MDVDGHGRGRGHSDGDRARKESRECKKDREGERNLANASPDDLLGCSRSEL